ncbi:YolD-like family protein, partial [Bacillus atrophaeus]|nr:YolD-like family protein [Bacillus atrophaeus]
FIEEVTGYVHYIYEVKQRLHVKDLKGDTNFMNLFNLINVNFK